jgi:cell division protein FtsQ
MLPKARARGARRFGWPFGRRRNRRVRAPEPAAPPEAEVVSGEPRPSLMRALAAWLASARRALVTALVGMLLGGGGWGARWYVTHARHFQVRVVRVSPLRHIDAASLIARAGVPLGTNLFAVDRDEVARSVAQEPWVQKAQARLELPSTVMIDVVEREAACTVALGALYLADANGLVFKRATPDEAADLPVVTGLARDEYLADATRAAGDIRAALSAAAAWRAGGARPPLGELHFDRVAGLTLYTTAGVGVRLGAVDDSVGKRLQRLDAVLASLGATGEVPRLIYIDNRARPDRVTVKLASAKIPAHSGNRD